MELTAEQIMEIQERKDKMVAEIQTWGVIPYKDANLRSHRLPEVLVSNRKFTSMGFTEESVEDSKVHCSQCLAFLPISLVSLKECHRICSKCFAVGTPLNIATGMSHKDFCVICEKSETHLTGDRLKFCELISSNLHSELQKLLVAYKLISREMVCRIQNHGAPQLFTLLSALKDVHDQLQKIAPTKQNLIPIRRRLYRLQLHEDRIAKQFRMFFVWFYTER